MNSALHTTDGLIIRYIHRLLRGRAQGRFRYALTPIATFHVRPSGGLLRLRGMVLHLVSNFLLKPMFFFGQWR